MGSWSIPLAPIALAGGVVSLDPLKSEDAGRLAAAGSDPTIWTYLTSNADTPNAMEGYVSELLEQWRSGVALPLAVSRRSDGATVIFSVIADEWPVVRATIDARRGAQLER